LTEPASAKYKKSFDRLKDVFKEADKMLKKDLDSASKAEKLISKALKEEKSTLKKNAIKAANKAWDKFQKTKKSYKDYQLAVGAEITVATSTVVAGVASAATGTVTFGFGFVVGIWQTFKGVVALAKSIWKAWKSADKQRKVCEDSLKALHSTYDSKSKTVASIS